MKLTLQNYLQGAVLLILGIVLTLSYFQCSIPSYFPYFNSNASACGANEIIDDIYHQDSADGLDEIIPRDINNCDSDEDVDMTDVEQLLEMLSNEISFLDKEIESPTLKYSTQSPPTSLKISISEHITGRENDKASRIGMPNPSSKEGKTYNNAFLYNTLASALETYPAKTTLFSNLF